jgi:hypothetical protein
VRRTNGHAAYPVQSHVSLEDLLPSVEGPEEDLRFQQLREHLSAGCASCVRRLRIIQYLLQELLELGSTAKRPG